MLVIIAQFTVPAAARSRLLEQLDQMDQASASEAGCIYYRHALDMSDPNRVILTEVWRNEDALQAHFETPHFKEFFETGKRLGVRSSVQQYDASDTPKDSERFWLKRLRAAEERSND